VDLGPFFYIAITVYCLLVLFTFLQATTFYHSIRSILCLQQTGDIENLTVSWDKVLGCVVCRFHVAAGKNLHTDKFYGAIVRSIAKLAGIDLRKFGSFSYWFDNLGFTTEGRLAAVLIITFSWGFQLGGYTYIIPTLTPHHQQVFWRRCRGTKKKKLPRQVRASKTSTSFLAPLPGRKKISARGVSHF
jgi:hypothetical protein